MLQVKIAVPLLALLLGADAAPAATLSAHVVGRVPALSQGLKSQGCWATAAAMLLSWRRGTVIAPATVAAMAGRTFRNAWDSNTGLAGSDKALFLRRLHLVTEAPQDFTVEGWRDLIRDNGPLWVTTEQAYNVHGRVIVGLSGDGTGDGTFVTLIDPAGGISRRESLTKLTHDFDNVATDDMQSGEDFRPQIVHFAR